MIPKYMVSGDLGRWNDESSRSEIDIELLG